MKKIILLILLLSFAALANASTSITTASISGHWTLAGSPYLISNDVNVDGPNSLIIDPGVQVVFQGQYKFGVDGILYAKGTASQRISFYINDTTGWSTDLVTSAGGWHGVNISWYLGTSTDSSTLQYCDISYAKIDSAANHSGCAALGVYRPFTLKNCTVFQCKAINNVNASMVNFASVSAGNMEMGNCTFYNNKTTTVVYFSNAYGGSSYVHDNEIYNNNSIYTIFGDGLKLLFENNELHDNIAYDGILALNASSNPYRPGTIYSHTTIKGNKIHHNTNSRCSPIHLNGGFYNIIGNLVCNNQHIVSGPCGTIYGGGGMFLESSFPDSNFYNVKNNVIANNYSADFGGGIEVFQSNAIITNNQIINNKASTGGGIYVFNDPSISDSAFVTIKNNVFFNNVFTAGSFGLPDTLVNLWIGVGFNIEFDHNWTQRSFYADHYLAGTSFTLIGDTLTNVIGATPGLNAPTLTANVTDNAFTANFSLLPTSPCINMGDTTGAFPDSVDYACNPRIFGSAIDIGAYEYNPVLYALHTPVTTVPQKTLSVFPNPASNLMYISTPDPKGVLELQYISGKIIAEKKVTNTLTTFDIHSIPRGIYFATWNDGTGNKTAQKVVVE